MSSCFVCNGSIYYYSHKEDGKLMCSAMCHARYVNWRDNEQLSIPFPKKEEAIDEEGDACRCAKCRDPTSAATA